MAVSVYANLYQKDNDIDPSFPLHGKFPILTKNQLKILSMTIDYKDVKEVVFDMDAYKALGLDSY